MSKEKAKIDIWMKDIAPSDNLRKWFGHTEGRWEEFKKRYKDELKDKKDLVKKIIALKSVTLLYAAKDIKKNNAIVLLEFLKDIN